MKVYIFNDKGVMKSTTPSYEVESRLGITENEYNLIHEAAMVAKTSSCNLLPNRCFYIVIKKNGHFRVDTALYIRNTNATFVTSNDTKVKFISGAIKAVFTTNEEAVRYARRLSTYTPDQLEVEKKISKLMERRAVLVDYSHRLENISVDNEVENDYEADYKMLEVAVIINKLNKEIENLTKKL